MGIGGATFPGIKYRIGVTTTPPRSFQFLFALSHLHIERSRQPSSRASVNEIDDQNSHSPPKVNFARGMKSPRMGDPPPACDRVSSRASTQYVFSKSQNALGTPARSRVTSRSEARNLGVGAIVGREIKNHLHNSEPGPASVHSVIHHLDSRESVEVIPSHRRAGGTKKLPVLIGVEEVLSSQLRQSPNACQI